MTIKQYTNEDHERFNHMLRSGVDLSPGAVERDRHYRWLQKYAEIGMDLTEVSTGKYLDASKVIEVTYNGYWRVCGKGNGRLRGHGMVSLKKFTSTEYYRHLVLTRNATDDT